MKTNHRALEEALSQKAIELRNEGFQTGLRGESLVLANEEVRHVLPLQPSQIQADDFLAAVRTGAIELRGGTRQQYQKVVQLFLKEAMQALGLERYPPFLRMVASAWVRLTTDRASEETTQSMARACAEKLMESWQLARFARLADSVLEVALHRIHVPDQIRAAGWLDGEIQRLRSQSLPTPGVILESEIPTPLYFLEKNRNTVLVKALKDDNPHYPETVSRSLPRIIDSVQSLLARMRASRDPKVLEAADHLGGTPGTSRRGNLNSLVNYAIASGLLLDYVRAVESRFAGGDIVREIESMIAKLGGRPDVKESLKARKATLISRSIHHGTLDVPSQWAGKQPHPKNEAKLSLLESENQKLRNLLADLMLSRKEA